MRPSLALPLLSLVLLSGCQITIDSHYAETVDNYAAAASSVQLGMSPEQVRGILEPSQRCLSNIDRRGDERYLEGDSEVVIQYYRSGWRSDGRNTDDEYTPYLYRDGRLVSIGWQMHRVVMR